MKDGMPPPALRLSRRDSSRNGAGRMEVVESDSGHPARTALSSALLDIADGLRGEPDFEGDGGKRPPPSLQLQDLVPPDGFLVHERSLWDAIEPSQRDTRTAGGDTPVMTVGDRIKEARKARDGMSRPELSRLSGVPYPTLAGLENGDQRTSTAIPALAVALKVNPLWLQTGEGPRDAGDAGASHSQRPDFEKISGAVEVLRHYLELTGQPPELIFDPVYLEIMYEAVEEFGGDVRPDNVLDITKWAAKRMREDGGSSATNEVQGDRRTAGSKTA